MNINKIAAALALACVSLGASAADITYAVQKGVGYLPVEVMIAKGFYKAAGGTGEIKSVQSKTDQMTDSIVNGKFQFAAMGAVGAINQYDKSDGKVKILGGLAKANTYVYCRKDSGVADLRDVTKKTVIGILGADSLPYVTLRVAAQEQFGDWNRFADNVKRIDGGHPGIMAQMEAPADKRKPGDVDCATTAPPYSDIYAANKSQYTQVLSSYGLRPEGRLGDRIVPRHTFLVQIYNATYCAQDANIDNCIAIHEGVQKAQEWLSVAANRDEAVKIFMASPTGEGLDEKEAREAVISQVVLNADGQCNPDQPICSAFAASQLVSVGSYAAQLMIEGKIAHMPLAKLLSPFGQADISLPQTEAQRLRREARIAKMMGKKSS